MPLDKIYVLLYETPKKVKTMTVAVVEKIFLLLETLARADHALPLKQLAELTELPKPTAHRLLQTLQKLGYVVREGNSSDYLLGHRI